MKPFILLAHTFPLARSTAMRFRLIRALMTLGSDGGLVSRERLVTVSRQGSRGTKAGPLGCSRSSALPDLICIAVAVFAAVYFSLQLMRGVL